MQEFMHADRAGDSSKKQRIKQQLEKLGKVAFS
jgi:hypothetical protein